MVNRRSELVATTPEAASAQVAKLGTILGVWAHPDDEAYLSAGIMRLALESGQRVVCVTATAGEHGTDDPFTWPPEALGPARRMELLASFDALAAGLDSEIEHRWLGHADGRCSDVRTEVGAAQVGEMIDRVQPDTILTFDPSGLTGHPDHRAVAEWTAHALTSRPGIALLETVIVRSWAAHFGEAVDISTYFDDGYPVVTDDVNADLNLVLDDDLWTIKDQALRAHRTQADPVIKNLGPELWRAFSIVESFRTRRALVTDPTSTTGPSR